MNINMKRRSFLKTTAMTGAALSLGINRSLKASAELPIGIQLYTVREKSSQDFQGTLTKVAEIGYKYFEFAGYGGMEAGELNQFLGELGVQVCGTHEGYDNFLKDADKVIEFNQGIGSPYIIVPYMPQHVQQGGVNAVERFADNLNKFGYKAQQAGMQLCYHNHSFEFKKIDGERTIWDVLFSTADAGMVKAEMDVAWVYAADIDPVQLMDTWGDRVKLLHMKDLDESGTLAPVGEGVIDMPAVVEKAEQIGVEWYIVEQDRTRDNKDILDEIEISYKNMVKLLS